MKIFKNYFFHPILPIPSKITWNYTLNTYLWGDYVHNDLVEWINAFNEFFIAYEFDFGSSIIHFQYEMKHRAWVFFPKNVFIKTIANV